MFLQFFRHRCAEFCLFECTAVADREDGGRAEGGEAETVLPLWPQREGPAPAGVGGIVSATPPPFRHEGLAGRFLDRLDNRRSRLSDGERMTERWDEIIQGEADQKSASLSYRYRLKF